MVYCKVSLKTAEVIRVGYWGNTSNGGSQNCWDFILEKDHKLKKITIDHGDHIYSLTFTTESKGILYTSEKADGRNGGGTVSEVTHFLTNVHIHVDSFIYLLQL